MCRTLHVDLDDFPLSKTVTYLNSASISLMPRQAIDSMSDFQSKIAAGGTIGFDEEAELRCSDAAREKAAELFHAHPSEVAVLSSTSEAICSVAWSLNLKAGKNVVSTDADFPSVVYPWLRLAQEKHLEVRLAKNEGGIVSRREVERLVDDETSVLSISHVQYGTGQRFDLKWLVELAHSHGALLVLDATQSAGLVPIDVRRDDVDVIVAGGYKGMLGPFGVALLYVRKELAEALKPAMVGWRTAQDPYSLDSSRLVYPEGARRFEFSTMSYPAALGLAESLKYLRLVGYENVTEHVTKLTEHFIERVENNPKLQLTTILTPKNRDQHASIAAFRFRNRDQDSVAKALIQRKVIVSQRFNGVRFSFHVYNTERDLSTAENTLVETLTN